jgi:bifunctional DNase/RNase
MLLKSTIRKVKAALISRYFFDNWYALLIKYLLPKYVLARFGFSIKLKMKNSDYTNEVNHEVNPEVFERLIRRIFCRYVHDWKYDTLYGY